MPVIALSVRGSSCHTSSPTANVVLTFSRPGGHETEVVSRMVDNVGILNRSPTPSAVADAGSSFPLRDQLRSWLSPPDPSMNHNLARGAFHMRTGRWFLQDRTFKEWKSTGSSSLLWIHGGRMFAFCLYSLTVNRCLFL